MGIFKKLTTAAALSLAMSAPAFADQFVIDTKGAHAFVQFRVSHLGFSWLYGRFNDFSGEFTYDANDDSKNKVEVVVDMTSLDSNHSERDKHLRSKDYLDVRKFSEAKFVSTEYKSMGKDKAALKGNLTIMGKTKEVELDVEIIGGGEDPWGGYRQGFEGRTTIAASDFGLNVGDVDLILSVEGIRK